MKRANLTILASVILMLVVSVGVGAGTMAWFSDIETKQGNTFTADELDLVLSGTDSAPFAVSDVAPGDFGIKTITLSSTPGSMPGELDIVFTNFIQYENTLTEPELNPPWGTHDYENGVNAGELDFFLGFAAFVDVNKDGTFNAGDIQLTYSQDGGVTGQQRAYPGFWGGDFHYHPLSNMLGAWNNVMTLNGGESVNLVIMWQFPGPQAVNDGNYSHNIAQTDGLSFDIQATLEQPQV